MSEEQVTVKEGATASVECTAKGNPSPTLTWTRDAHSQNSTGQSLGSGVGVAYLVVESASSSDTGMYYCHASNVVTTATPARTKFIVMQPAREAEEDVVGRKGSWASVGGSGHLVCRVRAAPDPSFIWSTPEGIRLETGGSYIIQHPQLMDGLTLWSSVLEVEEVTRQDYGVYHCTANNHLGSVTVDRTLNPPTRPHPPLSLTVSSP
ncbi:lachesin-like [Homarus americanus]|uniref:lachesin-like n=1 Tax=Homarus americanus TaxID=6706 RepID=UPI001C4648B3|nr:lachesin-like [Homarus americanus]